MSIVHRITGVALYFGTVLLAWWLIAAAGGPGLLRLRQRASRAPGSGCVVLFGYSWALIHHMLGGLRHFVWDTGHGLGKPARDNLALATIIGSIALTIVLWVDRSAVAA